MISSNTKDFTNLTLLDKTNILFDILEFDTKQCKVMSVEELKITAPVVVVKIFEKIIGMSLDNSDHNHINESMLESNADVVLRTLQAKYGLNKSITPAQLVSGELIPLEQIIDNLYRLASKKPRLDGGLGDTQHTHHSFTRDDEDTKKRVHHISNRFNTNYANSLTEDLESSQSFEEWLSSRDRDELERLRCLQEAKQRKAYEKHKLMKKKNQNRRRRDHEVQEQRDRERELREKELQRERERERSYQQSLELEQRKARERRRQEDQALLNRQIQQQRDDDLKRRREQDLLKREHERRVQQELDRKQQDLKNQCDDELRQQRERELQLQRDREYQLQREKELQQLRDRELQQLRDRELQLQRDKALQDEIDRKRKDLQMQLDRELQQQRDFELQQQRDKELQLQLDRELQQQRELELQQQRERELQLHRDLEINQELDRQRRELELQLEREKRLHKERELQLQRDLELQKQREEELRNLRDRELQQRREKELLQENDKKMQQEIERKRNELQMQLDRERMQQRDRELMMTRDSDIQKRLDKELQQLLDRERQLQLDREHQQQHDLELQQQLELERQQMLSEPILTQASPLHRGMHVAYGGQSSLHSTASQATADSPEWKGWMDDGHPRRSGPAVPEDGPDDESTEVLRTSVHKHPAEKYCYDTYSGYRVKPRLLAQLVKQNNPGFNETTPSYGSQSQRNLKTPESTGNFNFSTPSPLRSLHSPLTSDSKKHLDRTSYVGSAKVLPCYKELEPLDLLITIEHSWKNANGTRFKSEQEKEISDNHTKVADHIFKYITKMTHSVVKPHVRFRVMRLNAQVHRQQFDVQNKEFSKHLEVQIAFKNSKGEVYPNLLFSKHKSRQWPSIKVLDKRIRAFYSRINMQLHAVESGDGYTTLEDFPQIDHDFTFLQETKRQKTPAIIDVFDARYLYSAEDSDNDMEDAFNADAEDEVLNYRRI
jgi:hypothetical protein